MRKFVLCLIVSAVALVFAPQEAQAGRRYVANRWGERFARTLPWHGDYYYGTWGTPVALVVPPTSNMHTNIGWGVTQTTTRPIYHQFGRNYPGDGQWFSENGFMPTPRWPSHTDQFGVYPVRGPW